MAITKARRKLKISTDKAVKTIEKLLKEDVFDNIIALGVGSLGYQAFQKSNLGLQGAIMGLVSYKLARTEGNLSQAAGLVGLMTLGAVFTNPGVKKPEDLEGHTDAFWEKVTGLQCGEDEILEWDILHGWHCIPKPRGPGS